ncbi:hypothetical protein CBR_g48751 [Chara braunii]|uniref:Uncharacterized protein n=1 Tax=Chara braunii TaxID=69332 RepID=A0A388K4X9_CHABU|nr:hypothetical protein CBR_g48751 [Chara braunii]|eukprot:GBG65003.1 hypothetical protein CBR_g48751 [Chara braunii]
MSKRFQSIIDTVVVVANTSTTPGTTTIVLDTTTTLPDTSAIVLDTTAGALDTMTIVVDTTMIVFDTMRTIMLDTTTTVFDTTKTVVLDHHRGRHDHDRARQDDDRVRHDHDLVRHDDDRVRHDKDRVRRSCSTTSSDDHAWHDDDRAGHDVERARHGDHRVRHDSTIVFDTTTIVFDTRTIMFDMSTIALDMTTIASDTTTIVLDTTTIVLDTTTNTTMIVWDTTMIVSDTTTTVFNTTTNTTTIVWDTTTIVSDWTTTVFDTTTTVVDMTTCANKRHKEVNELSMSGRGMCLVQREVDGRLDIVVGGKVEDVGAWREVETKVVSIRDAIGGSLIGNSRRRRSGETSVAGVGDEVPIVDHKDKCWMLDWVGGIGEPSSGLVLYVLIKDNILSIGGVVKWSGRHSQFAMLELTMVLNAKGERMTNVKRVVFRWAKHAEYDKKLYDIFNPPGTKKLTLPDLPTVFAFFDSNVVAGHEPVVQAADRISKPKNVLSSSLEAAPSSRPITIGIRPFLQSLRTPGAATRVSKFGQIGEKGPCRGQIVLSAPVKSRTTSTKEPVSLVCPPRYDFDIPSRAQYFEDDDEENSEEDSEGDEECEKHEEGGDDSVEHGEEAEVESEQTISERGGPGELEGGLGIEYEDEGQEEETTGEGGYAQRLPSRHGHWGADRGRGGMHHEVTVVPVHTDAARLAEKKRKIRQERRSALDSKRTKQEGGTKQEEGHKRKLKLLLVDEAVRRTREAEEAMKKKRQRRKKTAKRGVMEKTFVFPADHPQSDEDDVGKTVTRPPSLQILPLDNSSGHLSKDFFLEFDENGNQRPEIQFITVKFDRILDIPEEEFRYNQRFLGQQHIDDIYDAMVESGEATITERTTGAAGVNVCTLYEKPVLLLVGLHDTMHTDASGTNVRARRVTPGEFDLQSVRNYYWYPLSGQRNVAAGRKCFQERPDIARELRLDYWTARPVYYPDRTMDNYGTLSTFQNAKDKWNTPPHQIAVIQDIRKLWLAAGRPEAIGGSAADAKNKEYREFAAMALCSTGIDHLVTLSLKSWTKEWSDFLGPYMILARATEEVFDKVREVYSAWESGQLSGRDAVKPATKQGELGKAPRPGPGFELVKGVRVPVHWIQGTRELGYLVAVHDLDVRSWKVMSTLGRRERFQLLRDILASSVILAPRLSKVAYTAGKHSMETYVAIVKLERAMFRMFHYFVFISDPHKKPSEWKEPFFDNLSDVFARYSDQGLTSERWIDQRQHFKDMSWMRSFSATLGGQDEKGKEGFKKTKSLAEKCPEEFIQFVNKLLPDPKPGVRETFIAKRLLRLNPEVSQSRQDVRTEEIFQEFKTSQWLEYLEEFYDRETSPAYGYNWHVKEDLKHREGERKRPSGGGAHGKGSGSSGGAHGKGLGSGSGASVKGPGPSDGSSGKDASRGELQKIERSQGRQATEGKGSGSSGGGHGKGSAWKGQGTSASAEGPTTSVGASDKGSGSSGGAQGRASGLSGGGSTIEGSHGRVEHDSGLALEHSRLDQAKKLTVESNSTVGSGSIVSATGKASRPSGGSSTVGGVSPVKGSHGRVEHDTRPALERSRLDQAKKLTVESNPTVGSKSLADTSGKASRPVGVVSPVKGSHGRVEHERGPLLERSQLDRAEKLVVESDPTLQWESIAGANAKTSGQKCGVSGKGVSTADQVWVTTMLVGDNDAMEIDITGTLTELQMPSSTMPAEVNTLSEEVKNSL